MTPITAHTLVRVAFLAATATADPARSGNLAPNPGLEELTGALPAGWSVLAMGTPARFTVDRQTVHGGNCSIRIDAAETTRSYLRSEAIAVVPGESLDITARVRTQGVPAEKGTVILIAEFARGTGKGEVAKVGTAEPKDGWQRLAGRITIPGGCDTLRLRMGFSYSMGTSWWDDVEVRAAEPLVARVPEDRLFPAEQNVPVDLLNRDGRKGRTRVAVDVGRQAFSQDLELDGESVQRVKLPARIGGRGKTELRLRLIDAVSGKEMWSGKPMPVTVPPPLKLSPPSPTHWVAEDGPPRIEGELELALEAGVAAHSPVRLTVVGQRERPLFETSLENVPLSGTWGFVLTPGTLEPGTYRIRAEVEAGGQTPVQVEQPWSVIGRSEASTRMNGDGFLEKNGRTVFPLGMFNNEAKLKEEVEAGFNIVHFYNAARVQAGRKPDDQRLADAMNRCHGAGMHVLLMVPLSFAYEGEWDAFRRRVRMFRNHPALLAWDEEEGLARGDMRIEGLRRIREILREEDPHHPLMVGDARDVIGRITDRGNMFPVEEMDLGMWWWYPLPLKPTAGDDLQGEEASSGLMLEPPAFLTGAKHGKPLWVGVQAYKKPGPQGRYPTPLEYRAQAYLAVVHGAKGLMWYGGSVTGGAFLNPDEAHWSELKKLVRELRDLEPLLLGGSGRVPAITPAEAAISAAVKTSGNRHVLIAVNRGPAAVDVRFGLPGLSGDAEVIGEGRRVRSGSEGLSDRFEAYATHVYELNVAR